jgi:hypothetical protein
MPGKVPSTLESSAVRAQLPRTRTKISINLQKKLFPYGEIDRKMLLLMTGTVRGNSQADRDRGFSVQVTTGDRCCKRDRMSVLGGTLRVKTEAKGTESGGFHLHLGLSCKDNALPMLDTAH